MELFISARNLFFAGDFGDNREMSENNLINQSRLESARKRRASLQKAHSATSSSTSRGDLAARGPETTILKTQSHGERSADRSASKVLTLAPKSYARNALSGTSPTESSSKNVDSSNSYSPMLLAALIREVENLDVPNGPFYL